MNDLHKAVWHYDAHRHNPDSIWAPIALWERIERELDRLELRGHYINAYMNERQKRAELVVVMADRSAALMLKLAVPT